MGWFSSMCSWVSDKVSSVASTVKETASKAYNWAKEKAAEACDWVAEKGEAFIDKVKKVYQVVKPFLQRAKPWIDGLAKAVAGYFPWAVPAIKLLGLVVDKLLKLENSPIAKKLEQGLRWTIKMAQFVKSRYLQPAELKEAKLHQHTFDEITQQLHTISMSAEEKNAILLQQMLNDYAIVKVELRDAIEMGTPDFQGYLRLRAVQKLLDQADYRLSETKHINDIDYDDVFLINMAQQLLSSSEMTAKQAQKLDDVVYKRFKKSLIPFVFEELLMVWVSKQNTLEKEWSVTSKEVAAIKVQKTRLEAAKKIGSLSEAETKEYEEVCGKLTGQEDKLHRVDKERRSMKSYVYAAEGFMQVLEKSEAQLIAEDKDYLLEDTAETASIIMRVANHNLDWDSLTEDEQSLITDYANIFCQEGQARAKHLAEQMAGEEIEMEIA